MNVIQLLATQVAAKLGLKLLYQCLLLIRTVISHWVSVNMLAFCNQTSLLTNMYDTCLTRRSFSQATVRKSIISLGFLTRLQMDLIDMRSMQLSTKTIQEPFLIYVGHVQKFCNPITKRNLWQDQFCIKFTNVYAYWNQYCFIFEQIDLNY